MARKGSTKVRSGCLTCKIRKVKCDEAKPTCKRCSSTGRKCDGYAPPPQEGVLWHRPRSLFPGFDDKQVSRAMQYFGEAVGPGLSGPEDSFFWTNLVMQFSHFEPVVRHSVVAISSLFEDMTNSANANKAPNLINNTFALHHYNSAITQLKTTKNEPLVLLVCLLFICIEFLQNNRLSAIQHCRHGIQILQRVENTYPWAKELLSPMFRRLSVFPHFFSTLMPGEFPMVQGLVDTLPSSFNSLGEATFHLDGMVTRCMSLAQYGLIYCLEGGPGVFHNPHIPVEQAREKSILCHLIVQWKTAFDELVKTQAATFTPEEKRRICHMSLRYTVSRAWTETAYNPDETAFDIWIDEFRRVVQLTEDTFPPTFDMYDKDSYLSSSAKPPVFTFEMGYTPLLYFVVMKCRCLRTRVRARALLQRLSLPRENLWEGSVFTHCSRRVIEIEHGIRLDEWERDGQWRGGEEDTYLPTNEERIITTSGGVECSSRAENGEMITGRMLAFFRRKANREVWLQTEFRPDSKVMSGFYREVEEES